MLDILWVAGGLFLGMHGLIHLMGFFAYWPLAVIPNLAYKTAILGGQVELGTLGMQVFSVLWLIPALGFIATSVAIIGRWNRWQSILLVITVISLVVTLLDWQVAFMGSAIDLAILIAFLIVSQTTKLIPARGH